MSVDEVLGRSTEDNLARYADGRIFLESNRGCLLVSIIKYNRDASFRYTGLAALVNEVLVQMLVFARAGLSPSWHSYLEILRANSRHVRNTQNEAD